MLACKLLRNPKKFFLQIEIFSMGKFMKIFWKKAFFILKMQQFLHPLLRLISLLFLF